MHGINGLTKSCNTYFLTTQRYILVFGDSVKLDLNDLNISKKVMSDEYVIAYLIMMNLY